jgi:hypothetical protein
MDLLEELRDNGLDYQKYKKPILDMMNQTREEAIKRTSQLEDCSREEVPNILILNSDHENLYDKYLALSFAIDYHENRQINAETEEIVELYLENVNFNGKSSNLKKHLQNYISDPEKINPDFNGQYSSEDNAITLKRLQYEILPTGDRPNAWPIFPLILNLQKISTGEEYFDALIRHEYTHRVLDRELSDLSELKREKPYLKAIDEAAAQAVSINMVGRSLNSDYYKERHHDNRALLETCTQAFVEFAEGKDKPVDEIRRRAVAVIEQIQEDETGRPEEMILGKSLREDFKKEKKLRAEIERIEYYFQDSIQILGLSEKEKELWESKRGRMGKDVIEMTDFLQEQNKELAELIAEKYSKNHEYFNIVADLESKLEDLKNFFKEEDGERKEIKQLVREFEKAKRRLNQDLSSRNTDENLENYRILLERSKNIVESLENTANRMLDEIENAEEEIKKLTETKLFQGRGFREMEGDIEHTIYIMVGMIDGAKEDIEGFIEDYERIRELVQRAETEIEEAN